jgi:hypothetical protein
LFPDNVARFVSNISGQSIPNSKIPKIGKIGKFQKIGPLSKYSMLLRQLSYTPFKEY